MPILDPNVVEFFSSSTEQSRRLGMQLGAVLGAGDVICLEGDLGAGKTTLAQGIAAGWGSPDNVTSPTFVLVNLYARPDGARLAHLDAYRLESAEEAEVLDLETLQEGGPLVVEWAEKIEGALPDERLWVKLSWVGEERRRIEMSPQGTHYKAMLEDFQEAVFGLA